MLYYMGLIADILKITFLEEPGRRRPGFKTQERTWIRLKYV